MSEDHEGEQREKCKEVMFVDKNSAKLIQKVTSVMPIADELKNKGMIHPEKYDEIEAKETDQEKMRKIFESFKSGGDTAKSAFYYLLEEHEEQLFKDLGGVSRKRKLADPECSVPCKRLNTNTMEQDNPNYNIASNSAPRPAPTYFVTTNIVNERPPHNLNNIPIMNEMKPPASKKEKNLPALKKEKKTPAPEKEKKPPAAKKEMKPPAAKKAKKPPAAKEMKPPAAKKKKPPAAKKEKKPPAAKEKKSPAPKKAK
uniref:CARD domain-containing protein n=1 Tax=Cyprinus carpio carpio TaxID=630221 RepID=A0A9J7ZKW5_CYPCA